MLSLPDGAQVVDDLPALLARDAAVGQSDLAENDTFHLLVKIVGLFTTHGLQGIHDASFGMAAGAVLFENWPDIALVAWILGRQKVGCAQAGQAGRKSDPAHAPILIPSDSLIPRNFRRPAFVTGAFGPSSNLLRAITVSDEFLFYLFST